MSNLDPGPRGKGAALKAFWTEEDERMLRWLRNRYEALLTRRRSLRTPGLQGFGQPVSSKALYQARRLRGVRFVAAADLLGEPVWDILLDLHSAQERDIELTVSSVCRGACVPASTASRALRGLELRGLVSRAAHPFDGRAQQVTLSEEANICMTRYLDDLQG